MKSSEKRDHWKHIHCSSSSIRELDVRVKLKKKEQNLGAAFHLLFHNTHTDFDLLPDTITSPPLHHLCFFSLQM